MTNREKAEELIENLKGFMITNVELNKLEVTQRLSVMGSALMGSILVALVASLFILIISLGMCFYISEKLGDSYSGFAIVAVFYFLVGIILIIERKKLIERPLRDKIIKKIFTKN